MCLPTGSISPFAWSSSRAALCKRFGVRPDHKAAITAGAAPTGQSLSEADLKAMVDNQRQADGNALLTLVDSETS